jgi:hypothetical protein
MDLEVFAVCAKSGKYKYVQSSRLTVPDNAEASAKAACPKGTSVTGGGVDNSGFDLGATILNTFPRASPTDQDTIPNDAWAGTAQNDHTGHSETMRTFAICEEPTIRPFSGSIANGGTVDFRVKFGSGKPRVVLPPIDFNNVPISCDQGQTTHSTTFHSKRPVTSNAFSGHADHEDIFPQATFAFSGHFNAAGTEASGTYREHGNLVNQHLHVDFTHCDTGTVHWSAAVHN